MIPMDGPIMILAGDVELPPSESLKSYVIPLIGYRASPWYRLLPCLLLIALLIALFIARALHHGRFSLFIGRAELSILGVYLRNRVI